MTFLVKTWYQAQLTLQRHWNNSLCSLRTPHMSSWYHLGLSARQRSTETYRKWVTALLTEYKLMNQNKPWESLWVIQWCICIVCENKKGYSRVEADLANMLIIETIPLAITEGFDAGVVVATCGAPRMDHYGKQLKGQQTLRIPRGKS